MISSYSLKVMDTVVSSMVCASDRAHARMSLEALKKFCHHPLQKYTYIFPTDTLDSIYHM